MKLLIAFCISTTLFWAAEIKIPRGAVEAGPGMYRHTDARGTKWIYRQTPFGVTRYEDKPSAPNSASDFIRATEAGDVIRFERPSPFGTYRWERNKSALTEVEKAAWDRQRSAAGRQD